MISLKSKAQSEAPYFQVHAPHIFMVANLIQFLITGSTVNGKDYA